MPSRDVLKVSNLEIHVDRGKKKLLDSCSFTIKAGEILSVIGPNGAGKSSLLKAISGDLEYQGQIEFSNLNSEPRQRAKQLSVLSQHSSLSFPFKAREVVALGRIPHSSGFDIDQEIVNQALELNDIGYLADRSYTDLSGGERQRVQLARVLAQIWRAEDVQDQPRILLLDEPTGALDLGHQHDLMRTLTTFAEQGVAILMILHDINLASRYSDKVLALLCSQTMAYGTPDQIINAELIKQLFQTEVEILRHPKNGAPMISAV
ncbi:MAG: heme ABC transporter ATP-binding protein [Pseudomonadota bacterium]